MCDLCNGQMSRCPYKNVFGAPGQGVHSLRIADIAVVDVGLTMLLGLIVSRASGWSFGPTTAACFLFGIVCHRVFCAETTVDKALFGGSGT